MGNVWMGETDMREEKCSVSDDICHVDSVFEMSTHRRGKNRPAVARNPTTIGSCCGRSLSFITLGIRFWMTSVPLIVPSPNCFQVSESYVKSKNDLYIE
jgi:hypothetical protein